MSDDPSMRGFYRDALGLELLEDAPECAYYAAGAHGRVEILSAGTPGAERLRRDAPAIGFLVKDLDASSEQARTTGATLDGPYEWHSDAERHRWAYFADPEGNVLLFVERR